MHGGCGQELLVELRWLTCAPCHTPEVGTFGWRAEMELLLQLESVEGAD